MIANLSEPATTDSPVLAPALPSPLDAILRQTDTNYGREDWLAARDCLRHAVEVAPGHPQLHDPVGRLDFRPKNYAKTPAAFHGVSRLTPNNPDLPQMDCQECCPDFFVISPPKTGSSWLSVNLGCHPDIFIPPQKELKYFSNYYKIQHFDSYLNNFKGAGSRIKGDASPSYAILPTTTIRSIRELYPDLKLIFLMRDPVERAWSHAKHSFKYRHINFKNYTGLWDAVPDEKWIENFIHPWPLAFGNYAGALRNWLRVFPKEQVFVGFYEEIIKNPKQLLQRIFDFLGVAAPVDWSSFNLKDRILQGIPEKLPERLRLRLQMLYAKKSRELVYYLRKEFDEEVPCEWAGSLTVPDELASPALSRHRAAEVRKMAIDNGSIEVLEEDFVDERVEQILAMDDEPAEPLLVEENYRGYNLLAFHNKVFALAVKLGPVDMAHTNRETLEQWKQTDSYFVADSVGEVKAHIDLVVNLTLESDRAKLGVFTTKLNELRQRRYTPVAGANVNSIHVAASDLTASESYLAILLGDAFRPPWKLPKNCLGSRMNSTPSLNISTPGIDPDHSSSKKGSNA